MQDIPAFTFGVSEFTTWPWSFEEDVERYARLGVDAIEICEFKLNERDAGDQLALVAQHGLGVSSIQPATRTLFPSQSEPEPTEIPERMRLFRQTIERFGTMAEGVPFVTNTGNPPNGNMQLVLDTAAREYRSLADFAREFGALVAVEPLNPTIMNIETVVWTLGQAMQLVHAVDRENFGICLDSWNIWQNANLTPTIEGCGDRVFVVQLSDWRTPQSYQDRLIPGQGAIPLAPILRACHNSGFRRPYVVEIFSGDVPDSLWKDDLERVIIESRDGVREAWQTAFK